MVNKAVNLLDDVNEIIEKYDVETLAGMFSDMVLRELAMQKGRVSQYGLFDTIEELEQRLEAIEKIESLANHVGNTEEGRIKTLREAYKHISAAVSISDLSNTDGPIATLFELLLIKTREEAQSSLERELNSLGRISNNGQSHYIYKKEGTRGDFYFMSDFDISDLTRLPKQFMDFEGIKLYVEKGISTGRYHRKAIFEFKFSDIGNLANLQEYIHNIISAMAIQRNVTNRLNTLLRPGTNQGESLIHAPIINSYPTTQEGGDTLIQKDPNYFIAAALGPGNSQILCVHPKDGRLSINHGIKLISLETENWNPIKLAQPFKLDTGAYELARQAIEYRLPV